MRVGLIAADLSHNHGWAHYSLELALALQRNGVEVRCITSHNSPAHSDVEQHRILPNLVPRERLNFVKMLAQLPKLHQLLQNYDLIHCCVEPFAVLGDTAAGKRPFFQAGVGSYLYVDRWQHPPLSLLTKRAIAHSRLVCISRYTAKVARQQFPNTHIDIISLGIDPSRFAELPPPQMDRPAGHLILTVGGVKYRKGTLPLVKAMAKVRQVYPSAHCIVLGSTAEGSDYTREVRATISALGLEDCVDLKGFVSDEALRAWYAAADVFVLPSMNRDWMFEGYGLVHMEASAAGLPVIGTYGSGVEDAIDDGVTGLLVSQEHVNDELPQAIIGLLSNPERRKAMGAAGRRRAQTQTWDRVGQEMIALYEAALHPSTKGKSHR
jgi:glycosyltransferase involved in cell wall biosynthesis